MPNRSQGLPPAFPHAAAVPAADKDNFIVFGFGILAVFLVPLAVAGALVMPSAGWETGWDDWRAGSNTGVGRNAVHPFAL